ncbi:acyltransferase family protein [Kineosporia succinea]|uniref:Peptidoglycan/LPS O-acetylase OafA/YrhL n=1 Tax=Kineosporia succinea TaxID=84632 RepID=A0ABT9PEQ9_9ACTN|nr:acyltransferase [Kineosporia succinea]MDP9831193.1 peptidoglycan/LPS O-acetylase OafA/YrhL [Kineosporia succinea]
MSIHTGRRVARRYATPPLARHAVHPPTLATAFDPRDNALNVMRLALAVLVAVVHASFLGYGWQPHIGHTEVGALAVDAFFVLSGFLVVRSYLRLKSLPRYVWHRALRILPGFYACLTVTALFIAPLLAVVVGRPATSVLSGEDSSVGYLTANAGLLMRQFGIAGLPGTGGNPDVVNGSLWTLFYEAFCYGLAAGLGLLGILTRRLWVLPMLIAGLWVATLASAVGVNPLGSEYLLRFALVFLLGTAGLLFADLIPIHAGLALGAFAVLMLSLLHFENYRVLGAPAFAYLCLYAMVRLPVPWEPRWDVSYGMYVWHWPVAQLLVALRITEFPGVVFVLAVVAVAGAVSALSWNLVEKPAMGLKHAAWVSRLERARPA